MWNVARRIGPYLGQRITPVSGLLLCCCVVACALVWYFDTIEDSALKILATALIGLGLALMFTSPPAPWRSRGESVWLAAFVVGALVALGADKLDHSAILVNAAIFVGVIALWWVVWQLMGRQWLLLTGFMFALAVLMVYWVSALALYDGQEEHLLLPVPTFILVGIAWSPCAWWIFSRAVRWKTRRVVGAAMQALVMLWLFLPAIVVTVGAPIVLGLGEIWIGVSISVSSFLLSTMVSNPLRRFLLEWGHLD